MGAAIQGGTRGAGERPAAREKQEAAPPGRQHLTFNLGGESFAIAISSIREIIEYRQPTDVPMMPGFIRGVINLRGRVVPVVDLSVRFGRAPSQVSRRTCIVMLEVAHEGQQQEIGVMVDSVSAVLEIAEADIEPPPSFGARLRSDFMTGMGKVNDKFVMILDTAQVLSIEELSMLGGIAGETPAPAA
jgi:purine-binding chemotaxis protein CheW